MKAKTKTKSNKGKKKYVAGGALLAASIGQSALGAGQSIFGGIQSRRAKREMDRLIANAPRPEVPAAIRKMADEPISAELLRAETEGSRRRTAESADALSRAGSRAMIGALPQITEQERIGDVERTGRLEQLRTNALGQLGQAEAQAQQQQQALWMQQLKGAQMERAAGDQSIMSGLKSLGSGVAAGFRADEIMKASKEAKKSEQGGVIDTPPVTEGAENHDTNPLLLVNKDGTPALDKETGRPIELTGDETVLNSEQRGEIEKLVDKGDGKGLKKYIDSLFKKKRFK